MRCQVLPILVFFSHCPEKTSNWFSTDQKVKTVFSNRFWSWCILALIEAVYNVLMGIWMCHFFATFWRLAYVRISVAFVHIRAALMPHWEVLRCAVHNIHDVLGYTNVFRLCLNVYLCRCNQCVNTQTYSDYIQMYWCDDLENITNYCSQCLVLKWIRLLNYTSDKCKSGLTGDTDMWLANTILMKLIWCKTFSNQPECVDEWM